LKQLISSIFIFLIIFPLLGCGKGENKNEVTNTSSQPRQASFSISQVHIQDDIIYLSGSNMNEITSVKVEKENVEYDLVIEQKESNHLSLRAISPLSFVLGTFYSLLISSASAQTSIPITFEIPQGGLDLADFGAEEGQFLVWNGSMWLAVDHYDLLDNVIAQTGDTIVWDGEDWVSTPYVGGGGSELILAGDGLFSVSGQNSVVTLNVDMGTEAGQIPYINSNSELVIDGMIESTTGGFVFPDGTIQESAAQEIEGPAGEDGATGAQGLAGPAGADGSDGAVGATGAQGLAGPAGADGSDGAIGATGAQGLAGPAGADGNDGAIGATGAQGLAGPAGADGNDGAIGATGAQGLAGPAGVDGSDGAVGATGAQGLAGPAGADGSDGAIGATGAQGLAGPAGADGNDGAIGATGAQGLAGPAGADGSDGATGAQGLAGPAGADGNDGAVGVTGAQGLAGPAGADGSDGAIGATGAQGLAGPAGVDGSDGTVGATGAQGAAGISPLVILESLSLVNTLIGSATATTVLTLNVAVSSPGKFLIKARAQVFSSGNGCNNKQASIGISEGIANTSIITDSEIKETVEKNKYVGLFTEAVIIAPSPGSYNFNLIIQWHSNNNCEIGKRNIIATFVNEN